MRRRVLLAAAATLAAGCLHANSYDPDEVRNDAQEYDYQALNQGDVEQGSSVHFPDARVRQISGGDGSDYRIVIDTRRTDEGWEDDVFGIWSEEELDLEEDDEVEVYGVYEGEWTHQGSDRTVPQITIVDYEQS
ncbi:MAG: hypothetical protein ACLFMT_03990 [Halobacteriales archaeon]